MRINSQISTPDLTARLERFWRLSDRKIRSLASDYDLRQGAPVFTRQGRYTTRGWTEWTLGFHFGSSLLQYDATGDDWHLDFGRENTLKRMEEHITHVGVHDHGFNIVSTFGNLRRLALERKIDAGPWERRYYDLALRASAAVQAHRWTRLPEGGFIYSFNGPHSLFADTIRSLRSLALGHLLGHHLAGEHDARISLLQRLAEHAITTARYSVYRGEGRDAFDVPGRVAHESLFNLNDRRYRCPNSQQGYSPRSTWTRGLAWIILGYAEQLEFLDALPRPELDEVASSTELLDLLEKTARVTADYYIDSSPANGIPYWDTGAPGLEKIPDHRDGPADPFNDFEPVDSSAATIAAQGLLRLGHFLSRRGDENKGRTYWQAGLTVADALLQPPYLSEEEEHQGLILHSIYHHPNGWDYVPPGREVPCGEASLWGDYHARELALYLQRVEGSEPYLTFWRDPS